MSEAMEAVSVVIPVYNSAAILPHLLPRLLKVLEGCASDYEIILVDDASRDGSWETIRQYAAANPRIRGIRMAENCGQHPATLTGIRLARHPLTVTMDDDLQHPPEEIPKLLAVMSEGVDVVFGVCSSRKQTRLRIVLGTAFRLLIEWLFGIRGAGRMTAFRLIRTSLRERFTIKHPSDAIVDLQIYLTASSIAKAPVTLAPRFAGQSNQTLPILVLAGLRVFLAFARHFWLHANTEGPELSWPVAERINA